MDDRRAAHSSTVTLALEATIDTGRAPPRDVTAIHREHGDFVWKMLQRMGVPERLLEDAMQDVFLVVHRRLASFDGSSALTTWLFGICVRVAAAQRRRASARHEVLVHELPSGAQPPDHRTPEQLAALHEAQQLLLTLLEGLEPSQRAVFVMFEIEGLTCVEIARLSGSPLGTVYSRLGMARDDFQAAVKRLRAKERQGGVKR
jgi:RNA polymerase sigma-70 factor (ECF subfamily)